MSASTRTLQQPLGFGQIGAALAVVAMVITIAAVLAFGALGAAKTVVPEYGTPPDARVQAPALSVQVAPDADEKGSGLSPSTVIPGYKGDPGIAPRQNGSSSFGGPRVRPD
jgi:hypothetical protein